MQAKKWILAATALAVILCLFACGKKTGLEGKVIDGNGQGIAGVKVISRDGVIADRAEVMAVEEITKTIKTPREVCEDVQVQAQAPVKDPHRVTGTVIGGVAGGILGNQIGHGRGRTLATVAGAAGGAFAGNQVQKSMQKSDVVTKTRRVCKTVYDESEKVVGYDVTYRLEGKEGVVRTSFKPGSTLPVKNGEVVATPPEA
jgi:uncharacterized protein YcfJ